MFPSWVVVLIITREFVVTGLRTVTMSAGRVIAASSWGKAKMFNSRLSLSPSLIPLRSMTLGPIAYRGVLIGIMTLVTIWSVQTT